MTTVDDKPLRKRNEEVERLVEASGRTQAAIAAYLTRRTGRPIEHYHVSRMINGQRKVAHDEMDALRELATEVAGDTPTSPQLTETGDVVPLFGYANGAGSTLRLNEDARVGVVPIHPAQKGSREAFAFLTFGDSVHPRLMHGETGYAIRNRMPFKNQLCVVEKKDGETIVKFFDFVDDRTLHLYEIHPKRAPILVPMRDVLAIHAVVGSTFGPG